MEYRLKINGVIFPDNLIAKGSYSLKKEKRVKASWKDGLGITHYAYYPTGKTIIEFNFREITNTEMDSYYDVLKASDNVTIQYYDDELKAYKTGKFKREDITFAHTTCTKSFIRYAPQKIRYVEY